MGAEFLAAAGGAGCVRGYYFEVEVLEAKGKLIVGFAGTNLGPKCLQVGGDACSWGSFDDGWKLHRCVGAGEGAQRRATLAAVCVGPGRQ